MFLQASLDVLVRPLESIMSPQKSLRWSLPTLVAFGAAQLLTSCTRAEATAHASEDPAVSVLTTEVTLTDSPKRLRLTGSLRGEQETDLAANVAGRVVKTEVERGQRVEKDALLARVDTQAARLALEEAKVGLRTSQTQAEIDRSECTRYEQLKAAAVISDLEYDQVTAKCKTAALVVQAAQARQQIAAKQVGDGQIRAPFSGVVTERYIEVGEYVQPSSRVVSLAQVDGLRVVFSVPERNYPDIKLGAEILISVAAYPARTFPGEVAHVSGAVRDTRDIIVEATVPNDKRELLPGMFAEVQLTTGIERLPSVPASAVFQQNGKQNVFVADGDRLVQRVIAPKEQVGDRVVVLRGLRAGDRVVTPYEPTLRNGARISDSAKPH